MKRMASEYLAVVAPNHKQQNAALGLLTSAETTQIKAAIQMVRDAVDVSESALLAITWNGHEATRAQACDKLETISLEPWS